ncbi:MAG: class I SAM-dependent methyltransferase [Oscillospiraceae bacterium]
MIDYGTAWKEQFDKRSIKGNPYQDDYETARSYDSSKRIWEDGYRRAAELNLPKESSVLDIGSGPGVLALPLAGLVHSVTALEPSSHMISFMKKHIREAALENISIVQSDWESVDLEKIGSHDIVIASYSLAMRDISRALIKMNRVAKKEVVLYWFAGIPTWEKLKLELFPLVYKKNFVPGPKSDYIYGALSRLGISPKVEPLKDTSFKHSFANREQAVSNVRNKMGVADDKFDGLFQEYVESKFVKTANSWVFDDRTDYVKISWQPIGDL